MPIETKKEKKALIPLIKALLNPIALKVDHIDAVLKRKRLPVKYYRNEDLKELFGLSSNTIIKYRRCGILPYTRLGDIYLYDAARIHEILQDNQV